MQSLISDLLVIINQKFFDFIKRNVQDIQDLTIFIDGGLLVYVEKAAESKIHQVSYPCSILDNPSRLLKELIDFSRKEISMQEIGEAHIYEPIYVGSEIRDSFHFK